MTRSLVEHCQSRIGQTWTETDQALVRNVLKQVDKLIQDVYDFLRDTASPDQESIQ